MRAALLVAACVVGSAPSLAHADRGAVWSIGATLDARAAAPSYAAAGSADGALLGGGQLTIGFEDAPIAMPAPEGVAYQLRLVPELLVGFVADRAHAEGYAGAGVRLEGDVASMRRSVNLRTGFYLAVRGIVLGDSRDPAAELVLGEWLSHGADRSRFGWEGGAMIRPRADGAPSDRELDALITIYVAFR